MKPFPKLREFPFPHSRFVIWAMPKRKGISCDSFPKLFNVMRFLKKNDMIFEQFARLVCEGMIFRFPEGRQLEDKKDFYGYRFPKSNEIIML